MLSTATAASTASGTHAADPTTAKPRASLQRAGNTAKQPGGAGGAGGGPVLHQQHHQQVQQHLQQQQQLLLRNPMHRQLWPHCEEQMAKMPALIGRLMTWRAVVEETLAYLKALEALETEVAKANGKLANQLLQLSSTSLLGMSWDSYQPLQKLIQQTSDGQMVFTRTMAETVMKRLQDLRTTITKKVKVCKQEFTRLNAHISKDRTATVQAISVHEKAKARKMVVNSVRDKKNPVDPWLTECVLYRQMRHMLSAENSYQRQLLDLVADIAEFDSAIVRELRDLFLEFGNARVRQIDHLKTQLATVLGTTETVDSTLFFRNFDTHYDVLQPTCLTAERTLQSFPYKIHEIEIAKQAILFRPGFWNLSAGGARGGVTRVPAGAAAAAGPAVGAATGAELFSIDSHALEDDVATEEGGASDLLHVRTSTTLTHSPPSPSSASSSTQKPSHALQHHGTLSGGGSSAARGGWSWSWKPALFVLTESGYLHCFKKAHGVRAADDRRRRMADSRKGVAVPPTTEMLAEEEAERPVYEDLESPATFYSICLSKPGRVSVDIAHDRPNQHVFAIFIQDAGKEGRGVSKYEIKASSEEEMVEWIASLRAIIEKFIPSNPPSPLFRSATELREQVDETVQRVKRQSHLHATTADFGGRTNAGNVTAGTATVSAAPASPVSVDVATVPPPPPPPPQLSSLRRRESMRTLDAGKDGTGSVNSGLEGDGAGSPARRLRSGHAKPSEVVSPPSRPPPPPPLPRVGTAVAHVA